MVAPFGQRIVHLALDGLELALGAHGADVHVVIGVQGLLAQRFHLLLEQFDERFVHVAVNVDPLDPAAGLATVLQAGPLSRR